MSKTTYPFNAWVLTHAYKLKEVTIEKAYYSSYPDYHVSDTNKIYREDELYPSKSVAILAGRQILAGQRKTLAKRLKTINKKQEALYKAEAELTKESQ